MLLFVKQKTAYEMRISDWSSDVCSSDLRDQLQLLALPQERAAAWLLSEGQLYAADGRRCTSILYLQHAQDRPSVLSDMRNAALCIWRWSRWVRNPCHQSALRSRSEEHTSELQSLMRISYAVFCLQKKHKKTNTA